MPFVCAHNIFFTFFPKRLDFLILVKKREKESCLFADYCQKDSSQLSLRCHWRPIVTILQDESLGLRVSAIHVLLDMPTLLPHI